MTACLRLQVDGEGVQEGLLLQDGGEGKPRSKSKMSRTRSHDPALGYGALDRYINKKSSLHID